ncbi:MAG: phenylalanine--tRNA ligase subunit alpha [Bacteroidetes bacterium]|nr:phenylalanine--tRNA ligase subunit alpha [Bacteroidota bacterium]
MLDEINKIRIELESRISTIKNSEELEKFRLDYLVKKGSIQSLFDRLKDVPKDEKPIVGKELNILRSFAEENYKSLKEKFSQTTETTPEIDLTLPGRKGFTGTHHPVLQTMREMNDIFIKMGFSIAEGPDIEDEYHNFDALNFPPDHPARDMQDTFFVKDDGGKYVLRTHTSGVQIRVMENNKPPVRVIMPGRVYRNEAISARSYCLFHQVEGLYVDKNVSLAELKGTISYFAKEFFNAEAKLRFRPSYFPFTEPSAEVDVNCFVCGGKGCRICKYSGWLEIMGCGMVDPNVFKYVKYDENEVSGFAFGMGIDRLALLRYGIDDIRLFFENDLRFLNQF